MILDLLGGVAGTMFLVLAAVALLWAPRPDRPIIVLLMVATCLLAITLIVLAHG